MYKIVAYSKFGREIVDSFNTEQEANSMCKEYAMAYGSQFIITVER